MLVLLLTAKAQESDVRRGYDAGADAYVKKPFSPADLSARVRGLLDPAAS
jgi:two-component system phosphate regulon response regulator PhoB